MSSQNDSWERMRREAGERAEYERRQREAAERADRERRSREAAVYERMRREAAERAENARINRSQVAAAFGSPYAKAELDTKGIWAWWWRDRK